jgi:hypothetical protein
MSLTKLTFLDKDGALAIPEITATAHAFANIGAILLITATFIRDVWIHGAPASYSEYATGVAALVASVSINVAALGAAQRIRDGLWKADGGSQ